MDGQLIGNRENESIAVGPLDDHAFRLMVESVSDYAIFMLTSEGYIASWNPGAERIKGYHASEILGRHFSTFYLPDEIASGKPEMELRVAKQQGKYREEGLRVRKDGSTFYADVTITAVFEDGKLRGFGKVTRDITERRRAEQQQRLLLDELNHRVKNTLATVQSITRQTLQKGVSLEEFRDAFEARLVALSHTHNLLTAGSWEGAPLRDIIAAELSPYLQVDAANLTASGPDVYLRPKPAVALGMALHELATNAAKHGAFSIPTGRVKLSWSKSGPLLRLEWKESGGPPVQAPKRKGFGSRLLERGLAHELGGKTRLDFAPAGLRCTIEIPLPLKPSAG